MKLYIIRHGETVLDQAQIHRDGTPPLSEVGKAQAHAIGERLIDIPIEMIYSSDYLRAYQTAVIIASHIHKPITVSELLREGKRPSEVVGRKYNDREAMEIKQTIIQHLDELNWHYSDEESYYDLQKRVNRFLQNLSGTPYENVAIVTHERIIQMFINCTMYKELKPSVCYQLNQRLRVSHTGVTILQYQKDGECDLLTWNDHHHL
jgi:broad specificity phosphatase PhoE